MEPPEIEQLDDRTIQQIAAGEVVERPGSVVKELVENSLDAGASRVAVSVEAGGKEGIRVRDDGVGIPADQLEAAVTEHATSKIGDIDDLESGVGTLGFRGEALYTVGAVSRLTVRSRPPGATAGAEISVAGGEIGATAPAGCPVGTTVEVEDLFFNTPARKKFLKRVTTEFDHVNTVVSSYALANPDVAVSLEHDGRETFATEGNGDRRSAVLAVYGRTVAESMVDIEWTPSPDDDAGPVTRVSGLVSHPETTRSSRDYLTTYVNDRYVTASVLRQAVLDAYGGQLAPDRYPFAVLFLEVSPADVDVNVHPRKLEVRFDEEATVRAAVEDAVESALLDHGLIRATAPRGRSAPEEVDIEPTSPADDVVGGAETTAPNRAETESERDDGGVSVEGKATTDQAAEEPEARTAGEENDVPARTESQTDAVALDPDDEDAWRVDALPGDGGGGGGGDGGKDGGGGGSKDRGVGRGGGGGRDRGRDRSLGRNKHEDKDQKQTKDTTQTGAHSEPAHEDGETWRSTDIEPHSEPAGREANDAKPSQSAPSVARHSETTQRTLAGDETSDEREYDSLPPLRVLGQLHETFVVAETPDGLVLIDQHAADERVHYEQLTEAFADGPPAQALATPVTIELTAREAAVFDTFIDALAEVGFRAERATDRTVTVTAVPAVFDAALDPTLIRDVLGDFLTDAADTADEEPPETDAVADAVDELLADLACYPSITGHTSLTDGRVVDLLARLDACTNPYACPHGRPVIIRIETAELASRFERDYPGHAGRRAE